MRSRSCTLLLLSLAACGDEQLRVIPCVESANAFDIEQVSTLEDAYALRNGGDSVILDDVPSRHPAGSTWRVGKVDVLLMIPESEFARYPANVKLDVLVWDGDNPLRSTPFTVSQTVALAALTWSKVTLRDPTLADEPKMQRAWWTFDFSTVIPESGMTASRYLVAVKWAPSQRPLVGASNFNRPCGDTWTDYADGEGWVRNAADEGDVCNWPMLRVATETITQKEVCD